MSRPRPTGPLTWMGLVFWLVVTFIAAYIGSRFQPGEWYAALVKPTLTPPAWIFGPVWTLLCAMMAIAAWLVWRRYGWANAIGPLGLFLGQLALNALWSFLFFGLQRPGDRVVLSVNWFNFLSFSARQNPLGKPQANIFIIGPSLLTNFFTK